MTGSKGPDGVFLQGTVRHDSKSKYETGVFQLTK